MSSRLRFLADESCDFAVVRSLRAAGHDVEAVGELESSTVDRDLIRRALEQERILLTEDKDFGWLVYASGERCPGVILFRFPATARTGIGKDAVSVVEGHARELEGAFVVVQPGFVRIEPRAP